MAKGYEDPHRQPHRIGEHVSDAREADAPAKAARDQAEQDKKTERLRQQKEREDAWAQFQAGMAEIAGEPVNSGRSEALYWTLPNGKSVRLASHYAVHDRSGADYSIIIAGPEVQHNPKDIRVWTPGQAAEALKMIADSP